MRNLKAIREAKGMAQKDLAKIVGVSPSAISQYESGGKTPSFETALKIAEALDCESADLVTARDITEHIKSKMSVIVESHKEAEIKDEKNTATNGDGTEKQIDELTEYANSLFSQLSTEKKILLIGRMQAELQNQAAPDAQKEYD